MQSVGALTRAGTRDGGGRVLGSRRRRGASEAAIDEARTRLAHATATRRHSLLIQPPLRRSFFFYLLYENISTTLVHDPANELTRKLSW